MHDRAFVSWIGRWQQARTGGCSPQACPVASAMTPAKSVVRQVSQPVVGAQVITIRPMNTGCIRRSVGGRRGCLDCLRRCARGNPRVRQRRSGRLLSKRVSFACELQPQVLSPLLRPQFADSIDPDGPAHLQQRCELVPQWTFAMAEEPEAVDRGRFRAGLLAIARCRAASSGLEDSIPDAKANLRMENHRRSVCDVVAWRLAAPRIRLVKLWRRCSVTPEPPRGRSDSAAAIPGRNAHLVLAESATDQYEAHDDMSIRRFKAALSRGALDSSGPWCRATMQSVCAGSLVRTALRSGGLSHRVVA